MLRLHPLLITALCLFVLGACVPSGRPALTLVQPMDIERTDRGDLAAIGGPMREVYAAVAIENLTAELVREAGIAELVFRYELANRSDDELELPPNTDYARPYYLFGTAREQIERLETDPAIPGLSAPFRLADGLYATTGRELILDFVPGRYELEPLESVEFERRIDVSEFPPGQYRFAVIYQTLPEDRSPPLELDRAALEFSLQS